MVSPVKTTQPRHYDLLRHSVYLTLQGKQLDNFKNYLPVISNWRLLLNEAESAALSNILFGHLQQVGFVVPSPHDVTFKALSARHIRNNRERINALAKILKSFNQHGIDSIVLKGMALIHTLYDESAQRPMGDIDILVMKNRAMEAQNLLRQLGYQTNDRKSGYLFDHHHLPVAHQTINGMRIQVEVHHNALSRDATSDMNFESLSTNRIAIDIQGEQTATLGHIDMLRHLCHHTFEPIDRIKLGAIADIYGYATKYRNEIDWAKLKNTQPFVINTLRCLHYLSPIPEQLIQYVTVPCSPAPRGIGQGFPTLSSTFSRPGSIMRKLSDCLNCSEWWLRIFYTVPPEAGITQTRWLSHPANIAFWLFRRGWGNIKNCFR